MFIISRVKSIKGNPRKGSKLTHGNNLYLYIKQIFSSQNRIFHNKKKKKASTESANDTKLEIKIGKQD